MGKNKNKKLEKSGWVNKKLWSWLLLIQIQSASCLKPRQGHSKNAEYHNAAYFSKKISFKPTNSAVLPEWPCSCVETEMVSCLISKVSQRMWTPCWHIHSTWATADSFECNLHNYTSSSPAKHMPQTPCCSERSSNRRKRHISERKPKKLFICIVWYVGVCYAPEIWPKPQPPLHKHTTPPPLKTYKERVKISQPGKMT